MIAAQRDPDDIFCFFGGCPMGTGCHSPCTIQRNRIHIAMSTSDDPANLLTSGMGAGWVKIVLNPQDNAHAGAFNGFGHFMNIATDEDNLFISVTDSSSTDTH